MKKSLYLLLFVFVLFSACSNSRGKKTELQYSSKDLEEAFFNPPDNAKARVFWWWLESHISKEGILHDLSEMKDKGIGGAIIIDVNTGENNVTRPAPGPLFMSEEWKDLFYYACRVADSLDIELTVNHGSGWNYGGPWITPDLAMKKLIWSQITIDGKKQVDTQLPLPEGIMKVEGTGKPYYKPYVVLAVKDNGLQVPPIENLDIKSVHTSYNIPFIKGLGYDWDVFMKPETASASDFNAKLSDIIDISDKVNEDGRLVWNVPEGRYKILRFVYTGTGMRAKRHTPGMEGYTMDFMNPDAAELQFKKVGAVLLNGLKNHNYKSLRYLHEDSFENGPCNWTQSFPEEFKKINGYDIRKYLPVLTGLIIENRDVSNRFLYDFRRTIGDLIAKNHFQKLKDLANEYGVGFSPESGGPHPAPFDALKNLGISDVPMGEFWIRSKTHRVEPERRMFVKQSASAAHIYGKRFVQAEGLTSIGPMWEEDFYYMKPTMDRAFCEGLNRLVIHSFSHSFKEAGIPGNVYYAGTHFNPNVTWWEQSKAFLTWNARVSFLLSRGLFTGDVCYYYGDNVPCQVPIKHTDPSLGEGYDYDVVNTEVILNCMDVREGKIVLPDGMSYRILVLPNSKAIKPEVLEKLEYLVKGGAVIVGPKPETSAGLKNYPQSEKHVRKIADRLWGKINGISITSNTYGKGKIYWGKSLRDILSNLNVSPDFTYESVSGNGSLDYIHREDGGCNIYYVANKKEKAERFNMSFRITGKQPELWNPVNGTIKKMQVFQQDENGRTTVPVFLQPFESMFIVFREDIAENHITGITKDGKNIFPGLPECDGGTELFDNHKDNLFLFGKKGDYELFSSENEKYTFKAEPSKKISVGNEWTLNFDPKWGGPREIKFNKLISWTDSDIDGIKYYSGTAKYSNNIVVTESDLKGKTLLLDLGEVHNVAEVTINGKYCGVWWTYPFKKDVTSFLKPGNNTLEIKIVNLWPNRIIGDQNLPEDKRFTKTNVTKFKRDYPLRISGLLGPVSIEIKNNYIADF